jgi:hypothetical protein
MSGRRYLVFPLPSMLYIFRTQKIITGQRLRLRVHK